MFIGHYGVAFALKRAEPRLSLAGLFVAVQLLDLFWVLFVLLGWEEVRIVPGLTAANPLEFVSYPFSHSLLAAGLWSLLAVGVYYSWPTRDTGHHGRRSLLIGLAVASHWVLDWIAHVPDLPLAGNDSPRVGLGLWENAQASLTVELALLGAGLALLLRTRGRIWRPMPLRLVSLGVLLAGIFVASLLGPPPPSVGVMLAADAVAFPVLVLLAVWAGASGTV